MIIFPLLEQLYQFEGWAVEEGGVGEGAAGELLQLLPQAPHGARDVGGEIEAWSVHQLQEGSALAVFLEILLLAILGNFELCFTEIFSDTHFLRPDLNLSTFSSLLRSSSIALYRTAALYINPSLEISNLLFWTITFPLFPLRSTPPSNFFILCAI